MVKETLMNKLSRLIAAAALAAAASVGAHAAALTGNCQSKAVSVTSDGALSVKLTRLWDEYSGEWADAADTVKDQAGGYWYKFSIAVGSDCVFYIDPSTVVSDNGGYYIGLEVFGDDDVYSLFNTYYDDSTGTAYWYIRASEWEEESSSTATFYAYISGDYPGVTCKFYHYCSSKTIADFAPQGSFLSPISIDVSSEGSRTAAPSAATVGECWYKTSFTAGNRYVFTCTPGSTNDACSVDVIPGSYDVEYDYSTYLDTATGECITKFLPYSDVDGSIMLMASSLTNSTFAWRQTLVGSLGFAATSVTVSDTSGVAVVTVKRTSNDVAHRVKWMTVAETAEAGADYTPASGELSFEAEGDYTATIEIPIVPGAYASEGTKSFALRLESVSDGELEENEYSPTPSPRVARVYITPTGEGKSDPDVPDADEEDADTELAAGSFRGVCAADGYASCVCMTSTVDGAVSAVFTDSGYVFEGDATEISCTATIGGLQYAMYLAPTLPSGTVEDLDDAPGGPATLSGNIFVDDGSGGVEEIFVSFDLYREESRLDTATLERMEEKAGRYTVSLAPNDSEWSGASQAYGYLTLDVAASGETTLSGLLPGGSGLQVSSSTTAYDTTNGVAVLVLAESDDVVLAGTLKLEGASCELSSSCGSVLAKGGEYDYWTDLTRLYNGWLLAADETCVLKGTDISASDEGEFVSSDSSMTLSLERTTGVLTGTNATYSFSAVILNHDMSQDAVAAAGCAFDADGNSYPVSFLLDWTDPDWTENWGISVTVSFDGNGGSGTAPTNMTSTIGSKITLPDNTFTLDGNEFGGWMNPSNSYVYAAGEEINVPADDITFQAYWIDRTVNEALDCDLDFSVVNWNVASDSTATNATCMKGLVQEAETSGTLTTTVDGAGKIAWRWKLVRRIDYWDNVALADTISLKVDGEVIATLADGDYTEFEVAEYEIAGSGTHTVVWEYNCPYASGGWGISNEDSAGISLDCVGWESYSSDYALVTFFPGDDATVSPEYKRILKGEAIGTLPTPECDTRDFVCWTNSAGAVVTEETVMPKKGLDLYAEWEAKSWTVSFDAGGADGDVPAGQSAKEGESVTLPDEGSLSMGDDYEFAGWTDGSSVYAAAASYTVPASNVTLTATWADARVKNALDTDLSFSAENWNVASDSTATNATCMKGLVQDAETSGTLTTTVNGAGKLAWRWKLVRRIDYWDGVALDYSITLKIDGETVTTLCGADYVDFAATECEISGSGTHKVVWEYNCPYASGGWGLGNEGSAVTAIDFVTWTAAAPTDFSDAVVTATTVPSDLGITNGTFAAESAGSTNLYKLVAWAKANGITVAEVNAMTFTSNPNTTLEAAYLFNCAEDEVESMTAAFAITDFSVAADGTVTLTPADGSDYGNGYIEVRSCETLDGTYTADEKTGTRLFFRLYLVK